LKPDGQGKPDAGQPDLDALTRSMQELFAVREARDLERLQTVLDFAAERGCLTHRLLRYFGEAVGSQGSDEARVRCGSCTSCEDPPPKLSKSRGATSREIPVSTVPEITAAQSSAIESLVAENRSSLATPRQLARFLCGLTSPATSRERLGRHTAFGLLARVPFATVLARAESLAAQE
jgi:ATP-dependent DNA helicase RecQ